MQAQVIHELNVKQLEFIEDESALQSFVVKPNFTKVGPKFGKRLPRLQQALSSADAQEVGMKVVAGEPLELSIDGARVVLAPDDLIVERAPTVGLAVVSENGTIVALDTKITGELRHEGLARDFVRYVQDLRKRAAFNVSDRIVLRYYAEGEAANAIVQHAEYIRQETLADALSTGEDTAGGLSATFTLGGRPVRITVVRVEVAREREKDVVA
jgi:isoleucyl-tRNA synthetase